ncbi:MULTISPECIES: hypothetical protein [unclassified Tolypothrix]|uniref:hypothetical protein n=1 Tax=unclassified Tolypothrix TaxID=2649714 RepID=UPI0005EABBA2|nr:MULTISPECIES: hypothetical protein [unclassified Tolypothrix]BAY91307.1 hypothetical protein NIES3275_33300 [Microchaete diplosiphon NIES-3275]EKF04572.1 hypothetical protein FDUTEX481_01841 [Tolypothrix sp. PCC 7601]MBE9080997.1 hypothetical protein [Tolypothrix sp. LEGE 11397]UYD25374.1 hypothetical protein HGR01_29010 [Tolypothrix sp. PCC 7712]UYD32381.1 hypothetical protein HG267_25550 [Tolypothrix sp. PCC 7601]
MAEVLFKAEIISPPSASIIITSTKGNQLKVGQLKKYAFPNQEWHGEEGVVTISLSGSGKALTPIALVSDQPLGVIDKESFSVLSEKLIAHGRKIQGFQFHATLESAPATIANIKLDPESIQYPKVWVTEQPLVKETKLGYLEELNTLLKQKYQKKNNQGLLHDDEAYLGAVRLNDEYFKVFMQQRGQNSESIKAIADEIERQLEGESFIGVAQKGNIEEIYFCITIPTERSQEQTAAKITDTFKFPLEYDQMENGQRTKFIAIPVDELQEIISQTDKVTATSSNLSQKLNNQEINLKLPNTDQQDLKKAHAEDISTPQAVQREDWEKLMLKDALLSLKANPANTGEEIQTATFAQNKYRVVYYSPLETLRIVDEVGHRGTLYKAQKGQSAQVCQFSEDEKKSFQQESQQYQCRDLQQE